MRQANFGFELSLAVNLIIVDPHSKITRCLQDLYCLRWSFIPAAEALLENKMSERDFPSQGIHVTLPVIYYDALIFFD